VTGPRDPIRSQGCDGVAVAQTPKRIVLCVLLPRRAA